MIDARDDDVAVMCFQRHVEGDDTSIIKMFIYHRVAADARVVGVVWMKDQVPVKIDAIFDVVVRRAGKARRNLRQVERALQARPLIHVVNRRDRVIHHCFSLASKTAPFGYLSFQIFKLLNTQKFIFHSGAVWSKMRALIGCRRCNNI